MSTTVEYTAELVQAVADSANYHAEWIEQCRALADSANDHQFDIGDLLAVGQEKWGKTAYIEAAHIFRGFSRATLKTFCQISRRVPVLLRNSTLSWQHHKEVARFDNKPELQEELLAHASAKGMSASAFRKHIIEKYPTTKSPKPTIDANARFHKLRAAVEKIYTSAERAAELPFHMKLLMEGMEGIPPSIAEELAAEQIAAEESTLKIGDFFAGHVAYTNPTAGPVGIYLQLVVRINRNGKNVVRIWENGCGKWRAKDFSVTSTSAVVLSSVEVRKAYPRALEELDKEQHAILVAGA